MLLRSWCGRKVARVLPAFLGSLVTYRHVGHRASQELLLCSVAQPLGDKGIAEHEEEEEELEEEGEAEQPWPVQLRCMLEIVNTGKLLGPGLHALIRKEAAIAYTRV